MAPPPATPTPHRFLVPRRSQPGRQETPKGFQAGGQQFQATPRFSLHSTPRAPGSGAAPPYLSSSARTPASASAGTGVGPGAFFRPTPRNTDPINDIISSSPPSSEQGPAGGGGGGKGHDPIDTEADADDADEYEDAVPESSPIRESSVRDASSSSQGEEEDGLRSRTPKRRRISISSDFGDDDDASSSQQHGHEVGGADHDQDIDMIQSSLPLPLPLPNHVSPSSSSPEVDININIDADADADAETDTPPPLASKPAAAQQQPTFQRAPRFKRAEAPEGSPRGDPPPDAFSPSRRRGGAPYVAGGLAAAARDWLVDVWASAGAPRDGWAARVRVGEVRAAPGAALVTGRRVGNGNEDEDDEEESGSGEGGGGGSVRLVLTGSPRLAGLAGREDVMRGAVLGIGRPTWDVEVRGQGRWAVVCEWAVLG
ncbi:hypothetical protein F4818DRAFT_456110 [Hypoxylon cercidicola]|nr:hypothetical protein F4818DRAFT_456110 [Hypoxylon cercidicola]